MKRYLNELNEGAVRKERGRITISKLKIWWKNERQREKRIQNKEMEKATQEDNRKTRTNRRKNETDVYVDDGDDVSVCDSAIETKSNLRGSNDPLLGVPIPSPHRQELSSPSPHRPDFGLHGLQSGGEPSPQRQDLVYRHDLGAMPPHPYRHDLVPGHLANQVVLSPYRHELGIRTIHAGDYAQIMPMQQDYPAQTERSPEHH